MVHFFTKLSCYSSVLRTSSVDKMIAKLIKTLGWGIVGCIYFLCGGVPIVVGCILYFIGWLCLGWVIGVDMLVNDYGYGKSVLAAWFLTGILHVGYSIVHD